MSRRVSQSLRPWMCKRRLMLITMGSFKYKIKVGTSPPSTNLLCPPPATPRVRNPSAVETSTALQSSSLLVTLSLINSAASLKLIIPTSRWIQCRRSSTKSASSSKNSTLSPKEALRGCRLNQLILSKTTTAMAPKNLISRSKARIIVEIASVIRVAAVKVDRAAAPQAVVAALVHQALHPDPPIQTLAQTVTHNQAEAVGEPQRRQVSTSAQSQHQSTSRRSSWRSSSAS